MNGLDEEEFMDELILNAKNEGSTYKDAPAAIDLQFKLFQARRMEEEIETFEIRKKEMVKRLNAYWKKH